MTDTPSSRMMALLEENNEIVSELAVLRTWAPSPDRSERIRTRELLRYELKGEILQLVKDLEDALAVAQKRCSDLSWAASPHATGQPYY